MFACVKFVDLHAFASTTLEADTTSGSSGNFFAKWLSITGFDSCLKVDDTIEMKQMVKSHSDTCWDTA